MSGDGNFKWYWAESEDAERWNGDEDSREAAIQAGRGNLGNEEFWIFEADKAVANADFDPERIAEIVMEDIYENNDCWDEDSDPDKIWPKGADEALSTVLKEAVDAWMEKFPPKTWCFGDTRTVEKIDPELGEVV